MKKYKLIKEYPGSPELHTEVIKNGTGYDRVDKSKPLKNWVIPVDIETYPEYWQEIIEKDYEILKFIDKANGNIIYKLDSQLKGVYCHIDGKAPFFTINALQYCHINSIKRLSDGEIFTIGDNIDSTISDLGRATELTGFKVMNNKLLLGLRNLGYYPLSSIVKPKQPLFKTEDGVDVYEGDEYYWVNINGDFKIWGACRATIIYQKENVPHFKSKIKAQEYIDNNKPKYSLSDIANVYYLSSTAGYIGMKVALEKLNK